MFPLKWYIAKIWPAGWPWYKSNTLFHYCKLRKPSLGMKRRYIASFLYLPTVQVLITFSMHTVSDLVTFLIYMQNCCLLSKEQHTMATTLAICFVYLKHSRWHLTPASSAWIQLCTPIALWPQLISLASEPLHATLSRRIRPVPGPNWANKTAVAPVGAG